MFVIRTKIKGVWMYVRGSELSAHFADKYESYENAVKIKFQIQEKNPQYTFDVVDEIAYNIEGGIPLAIAKDLGKQIEKEIKKNLEPIGHDYFKFMGRLKSMDIEQVAEMLHDLDDINVVLKLQKAVNKFIDGYVEYQDTETEGLSDFAEWKAADDRQRYKDLQFKGY